MSLQYNSDYLKFDAFSVKNAIVQNLSKDKNFTEQIFESSNLTSMIDTFSVLFEYLMYYTNHGASEAMFDDTRLYENINRIVKMLGYNPLGHFSSKITVAFQNKDEHEGTVFNSSDAQKEVSKYAYMDTGISDSRGNTIYYSPIRNFQINDINEPTDNNIFTAVNGRWKLYERTFVSNGDPFEEYILESLVLDADFNSEDDINYVSHPYIDVYVKTTDPVTGNFIYDLYEAVPDGNIFGNNTSTLKPNSQKFELRITENKRYTLKFGDGIHGKKLKQGDELYVVFLEGNGDSAKIGVNTINGAGKLIQSIAGASTDLYYALQNITPNNIVLQDELDNVLFKNVTESTSFTLLESVESIKENAPSWFRSGGHLVTRDDFRKFMLSRYSEDIYSVKIMNNYEYSVKFYKWLDKYNALTVQIRNFDYIYTDACDFNNIYIWIKPKYVDLNKQYILDSMTDKKTMTAEPILQNALDVIFVPCLNFNYSENSPIGFDNLKYNINDWDSDFENWIEIHKDINSSVSVEKIRSIVLREIRTFFDPLYNKIGGELNLNTLYTKLLSISGVKEVRTAYKPVSGSTDDISYYNGLAFAKWNPMILLGSDIDIIKGVVKLEDFQFPVLLEQGIESRIKVVSEAYNQTSIEY